MKMILCLILSKKVIDKSRHDLYEFSIHRVKGTAIKNRRKDCHEKNDTAQKKYL